MDLGRIILIVDQMQWERYSTLHNMGFNKIQTTSPSAHRMNVATSYVTLSLRAPSRHSGMPTSFGRLTHSRPGGMVQSQIQALCRPWKQVCMELRSWSPSV